MCKICDQCNCGSDSTSSDSNINRDMTYVISSIGVEANNKCNCVCDCAGCKDRRHSF